MSVAPAGLIRIDIDPVLHLGPLALHWYGVAYAVAFWAGWRFAVIPHLARRGMSRSDIDRGLTWVIVMGLLGARLYYDVQNVDKLATPLDWIAVWHGGMAFFGAIIAGLLTIAVIAWRQRLSFWMLADAGALFAVVGQPIGRLGNLVNGDVLGPPSDLPWATAYTHVTSAPGIVPPHCAVLQPGFACGVGYQPAALYEALATILIGLVLYQLRRRDVRDGVLIITYVALYAASQLVVFQWRASEPAVLLGLKQAQWTSIGVLAIGVPILILLWRLFPPRGTTLTSAPVAPHHPGTEAEDAAAASPDRLPA